MSEQIDLRAQLAQVIEKWREDADAAEESVHHPEWREAMYRTYLACADELAAILAPCLCGGAAGAAPRMDIVCPRCDELSTLLTASPAPDAAQQEPSTAPAAGVDERGVHAESLYDALSLIGMLAGKERLMPSDKANIRALVKQSKADVEQLLRSAPSLPEAVRVSAKAQREDQMYAARAADRLIEQWHTYRWPDGAKAAIIEAIEDAPRDELGMTEQFCRDLNDAHNEILRLQGVPPERYSDFDWPEWSAPANSIRWAEKYLGKPLSKTSLRPKGSSDVQDGDGLQRLKRHHAERHRSA